MPERIQLKIRQKRNRRILRTPLVVILLAGGAILALVLLQDSARKHGARAPEAAKDLTSGTSPLASQTASPLLEYRERIRPRTTIAEVLSNYGFSAAETYALYQQTKPVFDLRRIRAGNEIRLYAGLGGKIERLEYDLDRTTFLDIECLPGHFSAEIKSHPVEVQTRMIGGLIDESPILAFNKLGEEDVLALSFADLFGWDVDFYTDLRMGDSFKVIFEKKYLLGKFIGYGRILAAELVNRGRKYQAFYYQPPDSPKPGHYDAEGKSMEKEFRRSPIKWARITSRFSRSRLHPIHKVYQAHYGVDYGAPIGTEVQATADGTVIFAGWNGASGRMLRLRHKNAYETMYLHLRSFAAGIKVGARVKSGDVIGYVGSSGESTGPHLDYRIKLRGSYLNPLSARFAPVEPIKDEFLDDYKEAIKKYRLLLDDPFIVAPPGIL